MRIELWLIGKTSFGYIKEGMDLYEKRLKRYLPFDVQIIPDIKNAKNLNPKELKKKEGLLILKKLKPKDKLILLDEKGKTLNSIQFANLIEKNMLDAQKNLIFLVGGAYGFSPEVYQRANNKVSLSAMTFSHQIIRVIFMEQIYRAMTIIRNEPYHNV